MYEKRLKAVPPQLFTADGTNNGKITVADASLFRVKQRVIIESSTQTSSIFEVKRVESATELYVGPYSDHQKKATILDRSDMSQYLVADLAKISAEEQMRPQIPQQEIERITYEEEPVVARRSFLVDTLGNPFSATNPLPIQHRFTDVQIDYDDHSNPIAVRKYIGPLSSPTLFLEMEMTYDDDFNLIDIKTTYY